MIWFAEAYRWPTGSTWLALLNPRPEPQTMTVALLGTTITRTLTLAARSRLVVELGSWGASGDFGVEVACGSTCAAALTMWDRQMATAHESVPVLGCAGS